MENELSKAISYFESKNYNEALSILKRMPRMQGFDERVLYYMCLIYRDLKKWRLCKKTAYEYIKEHGQHWKILEILGDVNQFEGDYRKAKKFFMRSIKRVKDKEEQQRLLNRLKNNEKRAYEAKGKLKVALIVTEGTDNFTDDLVEKLSTHFWIRKFIMPRMSSCFYVLLNKLLKRRIIKPLLYKLLIRIFPSNLKKAISWAEVIWVEWFSDLAVATSYLKKKDKKLFIRLHRYEAFTDYPFLVNWGNVDGVVFVSNFMREILKMRGVDLGKIRTDVIYNGVDIDKLKFKRHDKGYNIGWVAHIILRKNLHIAFEIVGKLIERDGRYKLHIAGSFDDPMYEIYLKHLAKAVGIEDNVVFYGWVDDIDQWWKDKNYLLSTSIHEGHPYNIVEGMAKGLKPIIHNFYDAKELYDQEFLFNTIDEAVERIVNGGYDSAYYREYVIKRGWTLEEQTRKFKVFIEKLLNQ